MTSTRRAWRTAVAAAVAAAGLALVVPSAAPAGAEDPPPTITIGLERDQGFTDEHLALNGTVISDEVVLDVKRHPTVIRAGARPDQVTVGQRTPVAGSVVEPGATPRVVVQRRVNGKWSDRNVGAVNRTGHFFIVITPSQPGPYELRVRSAQGSRWSEPFTVNVSPRPIP